MPTIVHIEIPASHVEKAKDFYENVFDWKMKKWEDPAMKYYSVETTDLDGKEGVTAGIGEKRPDNQELVVYIGVDNIEEYSKKIEENGGKILTSKMAVPEMGYLVVCKDPENNTFGLWKEDPTA